MNTNIDYPQVLKCYHSRACTQPVYGGYKGYPLIKCTITLEVLWTPCEVGVVGNTDIKSFSVFNRSIS